MMVHAIVDMKMFASDAHNSVCSLRTSALT